MDEFTPDQLAAYDQMATSVGEAIDELAKRVRELVAAGNQREAVVAGLARHLYETQEANAAGLAGLAAVTIDRLVTAEDHA